jgi:hypothetical protein
MFKKITTLVILVVFAIHTLSRVVVVFDFYANQQEIAAKLCENKNKPALKCNGKCQLSKKLQSLEKSEQQSPERKVENKPQDLSSRTFYSTIPYTDFSDTHKRLKSRNYGKPVHRSFTVFRPPISPVHFA